MSTEKFTNFATTTLNGSINNSTTTVVVTSASTFPASGNFRILIDHEIMLVTGRSSNTLTVTRGAEGSTAASHTNGVLVSHILTAGGFTQAVSENQGMPGYLPSNIPSLGTFTSADFTILNSGGKTITDIPGAIRVEFPAHNSSTDVLVFHRLRTVTATLAFTMSSYGSGTFIYPAVGIGLYNTGEVCFEAYRIGLTGTTGMCTDSNRWTDPTTNNGAIQGKVNCGVSDVWWLRLHDDGTNFKFQISNNGRHFIEALSLLKVSGSLFASPPPDRVCITIENFNNTLHPFVVNILGWTE